jgi:tetratricopeptide (TPR) repeat protein
MFFTRLRRRAKWVFLALAFIFALGFVGFGVGAGGSGIGDYISDLFHGSSSSSGQPSVEEARAKVEENPNDVQARKELATALQADGQIVAAIPELERYTDARPNDANALSQLAALYGARAEQVRRQLVTAQNSSSGSAFEQDLSNPSSQLPQALSGGPITDLEQEQASSKTNELVSEATSTYAKQADAYRQLTKLQPNEAANFLQLGQAEFFAGSNTDAIAAWEQFLKLAPDDPNAPLIKRQIKLLQKAQATGASGGGG